MKQTICILLLTMLICISHDQLAQGRETNINTAKPDISETNKETERSKLLQSALDKYMENAAIQDEITNVMGDDGKSHNYNLRKRPKNVNLKQRNAKKKAKTAIGKKAAGKKTKKTEDVIQKLATVRSTKSAQCRSADTTRQFTLTWSKLKDMANTVVSIFNSFGTRTTYVYVPSGTCAKKVYSSGPCSGSCHASNKNNNHAEMNMLEKCGKPTEFWLTNSPCTDCAKSLMSAYANHQKPTIRVAHFYTGGRGKDKELQAKQCLAKMARQGFRFQIWDWDSFKGNSYMDNQDCKEIVQKLINNCSFDEAQEDLKQILTEVEAMSKNPQVNTWCN